MMSIGTYSKKVELGSMDVDSIINAIHVCVDSISRPQSISQLLEAIQLAYDMKIDAEEFDKLLHIQNSIAHIQTNIVIDSAKRASGRVESNTILFHNELQNYRDEVRLLANKSNLRLVQS